MYSEKFERLVQLSKSGKKISGRIISQIPDDEKFELFKQHNIADISTIIYCVANNLDIPKCPVCASTISLISSKKGFRKFCSLLCSNKYNNKIHNKTKNILRSITLTKNYDNSLISASEYYLKENKTIKEVAGIYNIPHFQFRKYIIKNNLIRNDLKTIRHLNTWYENNNFLIDGTLNVLVENGETTKSISKKFNISPNSVAVYAKKIGLKWKNNSSYELMIRDFLTKNNIEFIEHDRKIISPFELDFFIPKHNLAIEINGEYWHSNEKKDNNYHLNKQIMCEEKGIHLLQFFTHEIDNQKEKVEDIIKTLLHLNTNKIFARKTILKELDKKTANLFLKENHLFGDANSSFCFGLYHNDELVSVATFRKPRFNKNYDIELIRFSNKLGYNVVGGLSKCISHIKNKFNNIISYSHRRLFLGTSYEKIGFIKTHQTVPGYFWYSKNNGIIINRYKTQKHKLNTNLSENEYMKQNGFVKVYDCGQNVFVFGAN